MVRTVPWVSFAERARQLSVRLSWSALVMTSLLLTGSALDAESPPEEKAASSQAEAAQKASVEPNWQQFSQRLDQAIQNDQKIIARFDDINEELAIIEVRATMKRSRPQP